MVVKINEAELKEKLIKLFEDFVEDSKNESIRKKAESLYWDYRSADIILNKELKKALDMNYSIAYPSIPINLIEETKKILKELRKE